MNQAEPRQYKSSQAARDRAKAWSVANRERRREIQRDHYWRNHPERKIGLPPEDRLERMIVRVPMAGCWLWAWAVNRNGYGKTKSDGRHITAHRWSWVIHRGSIPNGLFVLHRCDVPACVNPDHLFLGTHQDNADDREKKGRGHKMPIHREARLTDEEVLEIRRLHRKVTVVALGKQFGVHHSHISRIQNRKFWKHI